MKSTEFGDIRADDQKQFATSLEGSNNPFEIFLTQEQFKQIQKLLPVGYSLSISIKSNRWGQKKPKLIDLPSKPNTIDIPNLDKQKRKAYREAQQTIAGAPEFLKKAKTILDLLKKHKYAEPFLKPVDPIILGIPDYFDIIKEPMDLSTVNQRLLEGSYITQEEFETDVRKIWLNALKYNAPGSQIYAMTQEMSNYFEKLLSQENPNQAHTDQLKQQISKISKRLSDYEGENLGRAKHKNLSQKQSSDKPLSYTEKKNLSQLIRNLPSDSLWEVWRIVAPHTSTQGDEEIEFDIDTLPPKVARELESFVQNKLTQLNKKKAPSKKVESNKEATHSTSQPNFQNNQGKAVELTKPLSQISGNMHPLEEALVEEIKQNPANDENSENNESSFISGLDNSD